MSHILVCCRIRPPANGEQPQVRVSSSADKSLESGTTSDKPLSAQQAEITAGDNTFEIDQAFDARHSQKDLFERIVHPIINDSFEGFNVSLFSYGQTGSGKTHTLIGKDGDERGIIPRASEAIFARKEKLESSTSPKASCQVKLSVLEIYQERLLDLLDRSSGSGLGAGSIGSGGSGGGGGTMGPGPKKASLRLRQQADGAVWVEGLAEVPVVDEAEFDRLLRGALRRRVVGAHNMNDVSSRSHLCCIVAVAQTFHDSGTKINSKLHFIDLAGSEMVSEGDRPARAT